MTTITKRPVSEIDQPVSSDSKRACVEDDTISRLLAQIEAEFERRHDEKKKSFEKWEQEGIQISLNISLS